jgi:hypothetical protein
MIGFGESPHPTLTEGQRRAHIASALAFSPLPEIRHLNQSMPLILNRHRWQHRTALLHHGSSDHVHLEGPMVVDAAGFSRFGSYSGTAVGRWHWPILLSWRILMRHHTQHTGSLEERLADEAKQLRQQARKLPHGLARESLLRKAEQDETAIQMSEWLRPGKRDPIRDEVTAVYAIIFAGEKK